jgi:hypothetical protein
MADLTEGQRKRAEARQRRRGKSEAESEQADDGSGGEQPLDAVVNAAKVAAAGAAVGAAAAAAKALASRHDDGADEAETARDDEQGRPEPEESPPPEASDNREEEADAQAHEDDAPQDEPVEGAPLDHAREVVQRSREQLEELLGRPVESVSSLERTHDGWMVALEVVELSRIPESTDVLASYELELDEDLNFRRYQQARRYTRSQADRGEGS